MQTAFGPGLAWVERIDATGSGIGPRPLIALQGFSLDSDLTTKELRGQYKMALAIAQSEQKFSGKLTFAALQSRLLSDIVYGVTPAAGQLSVAYSEAGTVPASVSYVITVANSANFSDDLGVVYVSTGIPFSRVTTGPAAGQYSVSAGVYTFAAADANAAVLLAYMWNNNAAGSKLTIANQLQGVTPTFKFTFANPISPGPAGGGGQSLPIGIRLNACVVSKFTLPFRIDDWMVQELDFMAMADASGIVGYMSAVQ